MITGNQRLLWLDDDGRERFPYEIDCLERLGWQIDWALNGEEAVRALAKHRYDLVLLDQVFPFVTGDRHIDAWSGCRLLFWLRGEGVPPTAPWQSKWSKLASQQRPQNGNGEIPVVVISAFQDDHVDAAFKMIEPPPQILPKPIDDGLLLEIVRGIKPRGT